MKLNFQGNGIKLKIEIYSINLIFLFYLFRIAIPAFKILFLLLYTVFIVYFLLNYKSKIISAFIEFIKNHQIILLSALLLIIAFFASNKMYLTIFKDVINTIILISLFFIASVIITGKENLKIYYTNLIYLLILFASIVSLYELAEIFKIYPFNHTGITEQDIVVSSDSYQTDYNFALIPDFFGILGIFYFLQRPDNSRAKIIFFNFLLFFLSLNILLSGSRRGLILFCIMCLLLIMARFRLIFRKDGFLKTLCSSSGFFIPLVMILVVTLNIFVFLTSSQFKTIILQNIGSGNPAMANIEISKRLFRYISAFDKKISFSELLWNTSLDPKDPDSGWGYKPHKTQFPLTGNNVNILSPDVKGYLIDSTSNPLFYNNINIHESFTMLVDLIVAKGEKYRASVFCYVSENFRGNTVSFGNPYSSIDNGIVKGKVSAFYDLANKGHWQKLEIEFECSDGNTPLVMSFTFKGAKDSLKLNGYVIFADPRCSKLTGNKETMIIGSRLNDAAMFNDRNISTSIISSGCSLPVLSLIGMMPQQIDKDPVRKLASKFISEDTTYFPYKANIQTGSISSSFIYDRVVRWKFAIQIFEKEYNLRQKIFGGGFNFLNWYGFYFLQDKTISDWPHNPFLSILLYSGLIGLLIYCFFIYKVFQYYILYRREYPLLFIFFLITFFFTFFSGGSPFDPPIMGFFVILPFFIHSIHEKEKNSTKSELQE
jgi:hypothetical protein